MCVVHEAKRQEEYKEKKRRTMKASFVVWGV